MNRSPAIVLCTLLAATPAVGATDHRFELAAGGLLPRFSTDLRVDSPPGQGSRLNLEDQLGLENDTGVLFAGLQWRIARRHRLSVEYFSSERSGRRRLAEAVTVADETYPVGASVASRFELDVIPVSCAYSFVRTERHELAASLGVHWSRIDLALEADAALPVGDLDFKASASADLPLPQLGASYDFSPGARWRLGLRASWFALDVGDVDGSLTAAAATAEYWPVTWLGLGMGLDYYRLDVTANVDRYSGRAEYDYLAPRAFLKVGF